ncbi:DUF6919 domain-containing protein [Streptomyces sp. NPDC101455]|uniref:DUF6919 domain-containing protein n=1 Tax=Streptomyces sp. NPDC101455 TaxID=3366142 RepID=UPI0038255DDC
MKPRLPWMSRSDRRRWKAATSLADLGELMALYLEGAIASKPGYPANYGVDEETYALIPTLAACNRAGYVTTDSQPGDDLGPGFDGHMWAQRAAVQGFVTDYDLLRRLSDAADEAGLLMELTDSLDTGEPGIIATVRDGKPTTWFGGYTDGPNLRCTWHGIGDQALDDVFRAVQVGLAAPDFGAAEGQRLWDVLDAVTGCDLHEWTAAA